MSSSYHKCDQCGMPATSLARDVFRHEVPGAAFIEFTPVPGPVKAGCDQHPVNSEEIVTNQPPDRSTS